MRLPRLAQSSGQSNGELCKRPHSTWRSYLDFILGQINELCREVFAQCYLSVYVKQLGAGSDDDICVACWADAAIGNRPDMASTGGYVVGMV